MMSIYESIDKIEELLGREFDDAPRELQAKVQLARSAIHRRELGDALNKLREAQRLLDSGGKEVKAWRAEVAVTWALYYLAGGPETEPNDLLHKITEAQRLEPDNEQLDEIIRLIKAARQRYKDDGTR